MANKNAKYCGNCNRRLKSNTDRTATRTSPVGRGVTVCESCRRTQSKNVTK